MNAEEEMLLKINGKAWMIEWSKAEDRAKLLRFAGFENSNVTKTRDHFIINTGKEII